MALAVVTLALILAPALNPPTTSAPVPKVGVAKIVEEAEAVGPLFKTKIARSFLDAVDRLPRIESRTLYRTVDRKYLSKKDVEALPKEEREKLEEITASEQVFYTTKYGTPLAYARVLELLGDAGVESLSGKRIVDFGYGTIGHLRLMASCGAETTGIDVDSLLTAMYSEPDDTGSIKNPSGPRGKIALLDGEFPKDPKIVEALGEGYDIFTSKNTLKNGYIHPAEKVDPRMTIDLGVSDDEYVAAVAKLLKPGGYAMIYNICPAPNKPGEKYIPWADGRCPFAKEIWEKHGFEIIAFDKDDSAFARKMAHAFGWDAPPSGMDLEKDLFATYTLVKKHQ